MLVMETETAARGCWEKGLALVLVVAWAFLCLNWAADVPWICDEPLLIHNALQTNVTGRLARHGLTGTQGVEYGPLPTWLYQGFVFFSHDMVLLVIVRVACALGVLLAALLCIGRTAGLSLWGVPLLLFSPSIWFYSRLIWDNTFCIPLSVMAVAFYTLFLNGRRWAAGVTVLVCGALLLVHLMSVPLVVAIVLHALCLRRQNLKEARWIIIAALTAVAGAGAPYWPILIRGLAAGGQRLEFPGWSAILFTIGGGHWLSGMGFGYFVGQQWLDGAPAPLRIGLLLSSVVHLFVLGGAIVGGRHVYRVLRGTVLADRVFDLACISFATLAIQFVYFGVRGAVDQPHYYNASWFAYGFLAWLALDRLQRYPLGRVVSVLAIALPAACVAMLVFELHRTHGTRSLHYGPTLGDQIAVAEVLAAVGPQGRVVCDVPDIAQLPQRIGVLEELLPVTSARGASPGQFVWIHYRSTNPRDGSVIAEVMQLAAPSTLPSPASSPATAANNTPITR